MAQEQSLFYIDPAEWEQISSLISELPARIGQRAIQRAVNEGVDDILKKAQQNVNSLAEHPTGLLEKSLKRVLKKKYAPNFWIGSLAVDTGKKRGDGAFYWHMVEKGHAIYSAKGVGFSGTEKASKKRKTGVRDTGRRTKAMQYALKAYEMSKDSIVRNFTAKIKLELETSVMKMNKKKGK